MMIGVDVESVNRFKPFAAMLAQPTYNGVLTQVYTPSERAYCLSRSRPYQHFAARFAAKEAFLKALGTGLVAPIRWLDMTILPNKAGKPVVTCQGYVQSILSERRQRCWDVSISHTRDVAVAVVIIGAEHAY
jgi:holo-[acyl-carrier protein] synthase